MDNQSETGASPGDTQQPPLLPDPARGPMTLVWADGHGRQLGEEFRDRLASTALPQPVTPPVSWPPAHPTSHAWSSRPTPLHPVSPAWVSATLQGTCKYLVLPAP